MELNEHTNTLAGELGVITEDHPYDGEIRFLQFGEGNFLRGFVDQMIDVANRSGVMSGKVAIVQPIRRGMTAKLEAQGCVYSVLLQGKENGEAVRKRQVVSSVAKAFSPYDDYQTYENLAKLESLRFIVSNTTEAGIAFDANDRLDMEPPESYPGKLTKLLYTRYTHFSGNMDRGLVILPVELIEKNGATLLRCVKQYCDLWKLPKAFAEWLDRACIFCDTLVDRIITGYPAAHAEELFAEFGCRDEMMVTGEPFALWVIQSDRCEEVRQLLPLDRAGLHVVFTDNLTPYRERKVRVLNGAHTACVLGAYLAGENIVRGLMQDKLLRAFMERAVRTEIVPTVKLPREEVEQFAASVFERFENPFIDHKLLDISLNSVSKWRARVLPSVKDYVAQTGKLPAMLTFSFAALLAFYTPAQTEDGRNYGVRGEDRYEIRDGAAELAFFAENAGLETRVFVEKAAACEAFWGEDLTKISGFAAAVTQALDAIRKEGIRTAMSRILEA